MFSHTRVWRESIVREERASRDVGRWVGSGPSLQVGAPGVLGRGGEGSAGPCSEPRGKPWGHPNQDLLRFTGSGTF